MSAPAVSRYAPLAASAGAKWGIPPAVLLGLVEVESSGNIGSVSSAGAFGLTQFLPSTAGQYGVRRGDAASQLDGAAHYLHDLGYAKDPRHALNQYNGAQTIGGHPNPYADNVLAKAKGYGDVKAAGAPAGGGSGGGSLISGGEATKVLLSVVLVGAGAFLAIVGAQRLSKPVRARAGAQRPAGSA